MNRNRDPLLDRVAEEVPPRAPALERLEARREAKAGAARLRAGALGLMIAVMVVGGILLWSPLGSDDSSGTPGSGSSVPLVAAPGEYYYVRLANWSSSESNAPLPAHPDVVEFWYGPDDSGRAVYEEGGEPRDERFPPGQMPLVPLADLSTDGATILEQLNQRGSPGGASPNPIATTSPGRSQETTSLLRTLQDLLTMSAQFLTPEQVAAVFEGAQGIDGMSTQRGTTDPLGRPATTLSFVIDYNLGAGSRVEWYFEPETGQWMGEAWVDQGTGAATSATLVEMAGIATSLDALPGRDARYVPEGSTTPDFSRA